MKALAVKKRLPATVFALAFASLFNDIGTEMVFPLLPVFLVSLGAGPTFLGLVEGIADATGALLKYFSGTWSDRMSGRKPLVLFGYSVTGLVRPLVAFATAPWHVLAVRVTDRVGKGVRGTPRDLMIASSVEAHETGRAFGFQNALDHAGAVAGPIIATLLLAMHLPFRTIFLIAAIPGVFAVICVAIIKEPVNPRSVAAARTDGPPLKLPTRLKYLLAIFLLFALANSSDAFLLLRAKELGVPETWIPVLWGTLSVSKMVWSVFGGSWSDRVPRHRLVLIGWGIYAASYVLLGLANAPWHAWALFVFYGAFYGFTEPVEKALIRDLTPEAIRGRAFGLYNATLGLSAVPAGLLTGALWQNFGATTALWAGAGVALAAAALLIAWAQWMPPLEERSR